MVSKVLVAKEMIFCYISGINNPPIVMKLEISFILRYELLSGKEPVNMRPKVEAKLQLVSLMRMYYEKLRPKIV